MCVCVPLDRNCILWIYGQIAHLHNKVSYKQNDITPKCLY